ncbi:MAG: hypothetical protein CMO98_05635 [Woeseia sp.]|nr:hypothetical protein [Woeseia sp.]|tara:strand:- start:109 stop:474 length:366 start_codon:yes stop_codon:yes gene_type:complete
MNALGEPGIGFDELLAYLEGEILSESDRALRQKKVHLGSILGSKLAVAEMKPNADFAKLDDGQVLAPTPGKDFGAAFVKIPMVTASGLSSSMTASSLYHEKRLKVLDLRLERAKRKPITRE